MAYRVKLIFYLLLINFMMINDQVEARWNDYRGILESQQFKDVLELIKPNRLIEDTGKLLRSLRKNGTIEDKLEEAATECERDLILMEWGITQKKMWALKMLDASSKIPSGLLEGNIIDLGMFDECLNIKDTALGYDIQGHHCMYSISVNQGNVSIPINPTFSICLPSTCDAKDVADLINGTNKWFDQIDQICKIPSLCNKYEWLNQLVGLQVQVVSTSCAPIDTVVWDIEFIICTFILLSFFAFMVICTFFEIFSHSLSAGQRRSEIITTLSKFSLKKNAKAILNMESREGQLPAIHGIRFLSMAWVVLGHEHIMYLLGANVNNLAIFSWLQSWNSLYIFIAPFAVDTFFTISGFLMTYLFLKQIPKEKSFNVLLYYIHRFIRLTPSIIALIVLAIVYVPKLASGPRWDMLLNTSISTCRNKWWHTLLYMQNFIDKKNMCLQHLWYLAVDMQLFWISPLILYPLHRVPKLGLAILAAFLVASLAVPAAIISIRELPVMSFMHANITQALDVFTDTYEMPYIRASPWLIGIYLGFEVVNYTRRLTNVTTAIGWALAVFCFGFCTFGTRYFMEPDYKYDVVWETFFATISRPIWGIGICWIIFACINKRAGYISKFLSWRGFLPLSRLSYCVYLVHFVLQTINVASQRTAQYYSLHFIWRSTFSTLFMSFVVAFFFSLFFESPIMVLEKILKKRKQHSQSDSWDDLRDSEVGQSRSMKM